jgi:hypothetical protein
MRPRYGIAVLATAALALTGSTSSSAPSRDAGHAVARPTVAAQQSADELLAAAPDRTIASRSARTSVVMEVTGGGQTATVRGAGVFDFEHHSGSLELELPGVGKLPVIYVTVLMVDGVVYEKLPPWQRLGGKSWIRLGAPPEARGGTKAAHGGLNIVASPSVDDSSRALKLLLGVGKVTEVGRENIRDASTTHYRIVVNRQRLVRRMPVGSRAYYRQLIGGSGSFPAEAWVDDAGRVRKLSYRIGLGPTTAADQAGLPLTVAVAYEFYDFGVQAHVTEPPASEVADASPQ